MSIMYTSPFSMPPLLPRQGTLQMEALSEKASALIYSSYQRHCPQGIAEILCEALRPTCAATIAPTLSFIAIRRTGKPKATVCLSSLINTWPWPTLCAIARAG